MKEALESKGLMLWIGEGDERFGFVDVRSDAFMDLLWRLGNAPAAVTRTDLFNARNCMEALSHLLNQHHWLGRKDANAYFATVREATDEVDRIRLAAREEEGR